MDAQQPIKDPGGGGGQDPCQALQAVQQQLNDLERVKSRAAVLQQLCTETTKIRDSLADLVKRYNGLDSDQTCKTQRVKPYLSEGQSGEIDARVKDYLDKVEALRYALRDAQGKYSAAVTVRAQKDKARVDARAAYDLVRLEVPNFETQVKAGEALNKRADTLIARSSYGEAYAVLGVLRGKLDQTKPPADYLKRLYEAVAKLDRAEDEFRAADLNVVQTKKAMDDARAALEKGEPALLEKLLEGIRQLAAGNGGAAAGALRVAG